MTKITKLNRATIGTALAAVLAASVTATAPSPAFGQIATRPSNDVTLSVGTGRMVRLDGRMSDLFVANDAVADVQVRSANQIYIFGKSAGETTVYATNSAGRVVYSANVRVGNNIGTVDEMLREAMPGSQIRATPMNGMVLLTGTVVSPEDVEDANRLVQAYVGTTTQVMSRLKTATPLQVMLKVKIAEVSRSLVRDVGVNLETLDPTGGSTGFVFGRGRNVADFGAGGQVTFPRAENTSSVGLFLRDLFGLQVAGALDLNENNGLVTTLAEPTLSALSGETASFLAGGEFPIPISQSLGAISVEYKQFGVGLAFTPTVLENGRISMRVRPEVSELSTEGSIRLNGFQVPALTTRRAETTVELGSGQSFMIAGLLKNTSNNAYDRTPWIGSVPILGALFRSNNFRRSETELVIVITPYLVKPVSANQIALPTDGFRSAPDMERVLMGNEHDSVSGAPRPGPVVAPPVTVAPALSSMGPQQPQPNAAPVREAQRPATLPAGGKSASPGFTF